MNDRTRADAVYAALLTRQGKTWVVVHSAIGATDVWYADPRFCPQWGAVIPEVC